MNKSTFLTSIALTTAVGAGLGIYSLISPPAASPPALTHTDKRIDVRTEGAPMESKLPPERAALAVTMKPQPSLESDEDIAVESDTTATDLLAADAEDSRHVASLAAMLQEEQSARRRLESKLAELETTLASLERRLTTLIRNNGSNDQARGNRLDPNGRVDTESLVAAGFSAPEAENLAQRWGQQQMDLLYLRDQAIREDWIDTPRYREAARDLREGSLSLREELGDDAYDRLLYASGQPNRLAITSVFESSPGQVSGLRPGDVIVSYDGMPVRSGSDVRDATTDGTPGEPVTMEVLRDGQPVEIDIPRGPIGIRMDAVSIAPD